VEETKLAAALGVACWVVGQEVPCLEASVVVAGLAEESAMACRVVALEVGGREQTCFVAERQTFAGVVLKPIPSVRQFLVQGGRQVVYRMEKFEGWKSAYR
jgi:hypothetical protein